MASGYRPGRFLATAVREFAAARDPPSPLVGVRILDLAREQMYARTGQPAGEGNFDVSREPAE
jgi:hypothetical protein